MSCSPLRFGPLVAVWLRIEVGDDPQSLAVQGFADLGHPALRAGCRWISLRESQNPPARSGHVSPRRAAQRRVSLPQQGHGGHTQASDTTHTHPRPHPRARETPYPSKYEAEKF